MEVSEVELDQRPRNPQVVDGDLRQFFTLRLMEAAQNQRLELSPQLLNYVIELLVAFSETARLFAQREVRIPVLADMFSEALEADFHRRISLLRQAGDTSLVVSGYFPEALSRRSIDLNYYQQMGEVAYSQLSLLSEEANIFDELSGSFFSLSDLLNEVSEQTLRKNYSIAKLIDLYMKSGSIRVLDRLKKQGVIPLRGPKNPILI